MAYHGVDSEGGRVKKCHTCVGGDFGDVLLTHDVLDGEAAAVRGCLGGG